LVSPTATRLAGRASGAGGKALQAGDRGKVPAAAGTAAVAESIAAYNMPKVTERHGSEDLAAMALAPSTLFSYLPNRATLTIGQEAEFRPQLAALPAAFKLLGQLPQGLVLDSVSGVISGVPTSSMAQTNVVVEVDLIMGRSACAAVELEVVDFTRGGFVIGHMNEFEQGKFMMLFYVPEEGGESGENGCPLSVEDGDGGIKGRGAGGRLAKKAVIQGGVGGVAAGPPRTGRAARGIRNQQQPQGQQMAGSRGEAGGGGRSDAKAGSLARAQSPDWW